MIKFKITELGKRVYELEKELKCSTIIYFKDTLNQLFCEKDFEYLPDDLSFLLKNARAQGFAGYIPQMEASLEVATARAEGKIQFEGELKKPKDIPKLLRKKRTTDVFDITEEIGVIRFDNYLKQAERWLKKAKREVSKEEVKEWNFDAVREYLSLSDSNFSKINIDASEALNAVYKKGAAKETYICLDKAMEAIVEHDAIKFRIMTNRALDYAKTAKENIHDKVVWLNTMAKSKSLELKIKETKDIGDLYNNLKTFLETKNYSGLEAIANDAVELGHANLMHDCFTLLKATPTPKKILQAYKNSIKNQRGHTESDARTSTGVLFQSLLWLYFHGKLKDKTKKGIKEVLNRPLFDLYLNSAKEEINEDWPFEKVANGIKRKATTAHSYLTSLGYILPSDFEKKRVMFFVRR